ncbi:Protein priB [Vanrija pseudolonga]|uniref:Protein priB n=1 Tax=Vanrija pseudolonga TaxID=143232 RepID=A0AAF0YC95_9TREE|nr:Protein priB [Vanrija pseudolonga]
MSHSPVRNIRDKSIRACDGCRRMKVKCVDKETPPCRRCKANRVECKFNLTPGIPEPEASPDERLRALEAQIAGLREEMATLVRGTGGTAGFAPAMAMTPDDEEDHEHIVRVVHAPEAAAGSEEDDEEVVAPLRAEDVDRHQASPGRKRKRTASPSPSARLPAAPNPEQADAGVADPVSAGFCTEAEARRLFDRFMKHAHAFVPVLDPARDTFERLRAKPFVLTVILLTSAQVEDAYRAPSALQVQCRALAQSMSNATLFSAQASLDTVQAMVTLGSWSDLSWRPISYALSLGSEMGLYKCLPHLIRTGLGAGRTRAQAESDRPAVDGARVWMALQKMRLEIAFNEGRPVPFVDEPLDKLRSLLRHPLADINDSRSIVAIEFLQPRVPLHHVWTPDEGDCLPTAEIARVNDTFESRFHYWSSYYARAGLPRDHFLFLQLECQRSHAILHTNIKLLRGVRSRTDVRLMSKDRREILVTALHAADFVVTEFVHGSQGAHAEWGNRYFHIATVFAARALLRLATLLPEHVDLHRVGGDLDALVGKLPWLPGYPFASLMSKIIRRARRNGALPWPLGGTTPGAPDTGVTPSDVPSASEASDPFDLFSMDNLFPLFDLSQLSEDSEVNLDGQDWFDAVRMPDLPATAV